MRSRLLLVGGGLQNALIALAVLRKDPSANIVLVERAERLGGNHTWSFHTTDVPPALLELLDELVVCRWPGHTVRFPGFTRTFETPYASITSPRLHEVLVARMGAGPRTELLLGTSVVRVEPTTVVTAAGRKLEADRVIDARGPESGAREGGFQKFVGLELQLSHPWPWELPCLMDAQVEQRDGFRFVYSLPLTRHRVLVEETAYSVDSRLDAAEMRARVLAYVERRGSPVESVLREEQGVLPLPLAAFLPAHGSPLQGGYGGGWFHPTTGYSLPAAAMLAGLVSESWPDPPPVAQLSRLVQDLGRQIRFFTLLNRLLFEASPATERWRTLERFQRLPEETIQRFYGLRTTRLDRLLILLGRPPRGVSWRKAALAWTGLRGAT